MTIETNSLIIKLTFRTSKYSMQGYILKVLPDNNYRVYKKNTYYRNY